jgi:hypothetical protein
VKIIVHYLNPHLSLLVKRFLSSSKVSNVQTISVNTLKNGKSKVNLWFMIGKNVPCRQKKEKGRGSSKKLIKRSLIEDQITWPSYNLILLVFFHLSIFLPTYIDDLPKYHFLFIPAHDIRSIGSTFFEDG